MTEGIIEKAAAYVRELFAGNAGGHPIPQTSTNNGVDTIHDDGFTMSKMTGLGYVYHWIAIAHKS